MNLRGKIQVEPLDDERVTNIERKVVTGYADAVARGRAAGSRWLLPTLAAATAAAVVAAVLVWKLRPAHEPVAPAVAAAVRVEASPEGSTLDIGDATIAVTPGGAFEVTRPDGGVLVALDHGKVGLSVASRKGRAPLIVRAGDVDVIVVGTKFSVERTGEVVVEVTEGVVRVRRMGDEVRVAAGERWAAPVQVAAGTPMPQVTPIIQAQAGATVATADTNTEDIEMSSDTGTAGLHGRDPVVPTGASKDRGRKPHPTTDPTGAGSGDGSGSAAGSGIDDVAAAHHDASFARPCPVDATGDDVVPAYTAMLNNGAEAKLCAKYGLAYTYFKLGKKLDSLRWTDAYVVQGPKGPDIESVLWMRIQILCKHPVDDECRKAAATYEGRFRGSDRAAVAQRLMNTID